MYYISKDGSLKSTDELYHHGILGMKWGKLNGPPYPIGSGPKKPMKEREAAARERKKSRGGPIKRYKERKAEASRKKEIEERMKKVREAKTEKKEYEENRDRVLKSGTAEEISKYANDLSINELRDALDRYALNKRLANEVLKEQESKANKGWNEVNKAMKKVQDVSNWTESGAKILKNTNSIYKILSGQENKSSKKK